MSRWNIEDFYERDTILYDTLIMVSCHYISVKTHRLYNSKSKS